jgi:hypothetical protein
MNPLPNPASSAFATVVAAIAPDGKRGKAHRHAEPAADVVAAAQADLRPAQPGETVEFFIVVDRDFSFARGPFTFPHAAFVANEAMKQAGVVLRIVPISFPDYVQVTGWSRGKKVAEPAVETPRLSQGYL